MLFSKLKKKKTDEQGFTLLEVMAAIGIMSIMATIAVPNISSMKRDYFEQEIQQQLISVADVLDIHQNRGLHTTKFDLSKVSNEVQFVTSRKFSLQTQKTTTFKMTRDAEDYYCLTASSDGYTVVFDSRAGLKGEPSEVPTANCSLELDAPAYELGNDKVLRPVESLQVRPVPCPLRKGFSSSTLFDAGARNKFGQMEAVQLKGYFELQEDCQTIRFKLRVSEANPTDTYTVIMHPNTHSQRIVTFNGGLATEGEWKLPAVPTKTVSILGDVYNSKDRGYGWDSRIQWNLESDYTTPVQAGV